jgi:P-type Cu+ transporter
MDMPEAAKSIIGGIVALIGLLGIYFGTLTLAFGWGATLSQFVEFWPYIIALAIGFGAQVGLYLRLKQVSQRHHQGHCVAAASASGTTSAIAMLACCTHYLTNVLPMLGAVGAVTLVAQYQVELFWVGLAFNAAGLTYIGQQLWQAKHAFVGSHA